jgi:hypothetical protein
VARLGTSKSQSMEGMDDSLSVAGSVAALAEDSPLDLADTIRRRTLTVHARRRGADVLRDIAFDIVGIERDSTTVRDRLAITQLLDQPINEATEEALRVLVAELLGAIEAAPHGVRSAIAFSSVSGTDFE